MTFGLDRIEAFEQASTLEWADPRNYGICIERLLGIVLVCHLIPKPTHPTRMQLEVAPVLALHSLWSMTMTSCGLQLFRASVSVLYILSEFHY